MNQFSMLLALLLPHCDAATSPAADQAGPFEISVQRDGDQVNVTTRDIEQVFSINSRSGIGSATITRTDDRWPAAMVLHVHLRGLESLKISNDQVTLAASVLSHGDHMRLLHVWKDGNEGPQLDHRSPYWSAISIVDKEGKPALERIPLQAGYFQMTIPPSLVAHNPKSIRLAWIDFYR